MIPKPYICWNLLASRSRIPYRFIDRANPEALSNLPKLEGIPATGTVAMTGRSHLLIEPTPREVAVALGLDLRVDNTIPFDMLIVGAGPSGLAAAV